MQDRSDLRVGLVIGGLVGALLGILVAPARGEDTRRQVAERAGDVTTFLRDGSTRLSSQAGRSAQELARRVRGGIDGEARADAPAGAGAEAAATGEPGEDDLDGGVGEQA